jgi:hypothetical protein
LIFAGFGQTLTGLTNGVATAVGIGLDILSSSVLVERLEPVKPMLS